MILRLKLTKFMRRLMVMIKMALSDFLHFRQKNIKLSVEDVTKERIQKDLPYLQKLVAYWRWYPDKFVDFLCSLNPDNMFKFFFYQRV